MTHEKLIETIKKLLALGDSSNPHEAELALKRAKELMEKHCIQIVDDEKEEIIECIYSPPMSLSKFAKSELPYIVLTISKMFQCVSTVSLGLSNTIYGFKTNTKIATYAIDCILNQLTCEFKESYKKNPSVSFSIGFWKGATDAIREKFESKESEETGLILFNKAVEYRDKKFPKLSWYANFNQSGVGKNEGYQAGLNTSIRQGVSSGNQGRLLK